MNTYATDMPIQRTTHISSLNQIKCQADDQIGQWTWGNIRVATRSFDIDGRLTAFSKAGSSATIAYDNADRIINMGPTAAARAGHKVSPTTTTMR